MRRRIRQFTFLIALYAMVMTPIAGLAEAQGDPTITPENANLLSEQATVDLGATTTTYAPVWSAQSDLVAVPIGAGGTQLVDMATLSVSGNLPVVTEGAEAVSVAINPGGWAIATGEITPDGSISRLQLWDLEGQFPIPGSSIEAESYTHLRFMHDEQVFAGGAEGARFMEVSGGDTGEILPLIQLIRPVISPDGTRLVVYQPNGPQILEVETGAVMGQAITPVSPADSVFSDDGLLLTVAVDARFSTTAEVVPLQIFDAFSGVLLRTMQGEFSTILSPTFSPDGRLLAAATCANYDATDENCLTPEIWLWDTTSGQKVGGFIFASNTNITGLSFSPNGQWLAAVFNGALHLYGLFAPVVSATPTPEAATSDVGQAIAPTPGTYRLDSTATACDGYGVADGAQVSTTHTVTVTQLPPDSLEVKISGTMAGAPLFLLGGVAGRGSGTFQAYLFLGGATTANFSEVTLELVSAEMMRGTFQSADCLLDFTLTLEQADPNAAATPSISLGVTGCQVISESPVNKRAAPSTDAEKVGELSGRDVGHVTGQTTGADGQIWYQLTDGSWVRSDVVDDNGLCADVPFVNP
ncbi:MAG: hypothetical protein BroJett018_51340 [Chloroflexota bacterium]|nr:MAG: hypothetical protein BroJett018_51340 [Chloroflexota bacterium]